MLFTRKFKRVSNFDSEAYHFQDIEDNTLTVCHTLQLSIQNSAPSAGAAPNQASGCMRLACLT